MSRPGSATAMLGAALLALMSLNGCTGRAPEAQAPPPVASPPGPSPSPDLLGGPKAAAAPSDQPAASEQTFTPMAPIANPEDMSPEERAQVYGHRYDRTHDEQEARSARVRHPTRYYIGGGAGATRHRLGHHRHARRGWRHRGAYGARALHMGVEPRAGLATTPHREGKNQSTAKSASPPSAAQPGATTTRPATPSAPPASTSSQAGSPNLDWLNIPGAPYVDLPGLGRVPSRFITAGALLLLAIALLAFAASRGQGAGIRKRPARNTVGSGPAFADERPAEPAKDQAAAEAPIAPFPHDDHDAPPPGTAG